MDHTANPCPTCGFFAPETSADEGRTLVAPAPAIGSTPHDGHAPTFVDVVLTSVDLALTSVDVALTSVDVALTSVDVALTSVDVAPPPFFASAADVDVEVGGSADALASTEVEETFFSRAPVRRPSQHKRRCASSPPPLPIDALRRSSAPAPSFELPLASHAVLEPLGLESDEERAFFSRPPRSGTRRRLSFLLPAGVGNLDDETVFALVRPSRNSIDWATVPEIDDSLADSDPHHEIPIERERTG